MKHRLAACGCLLLLFGIGVSARPDSASHETENHCQWLARRIEELQSIKVGMTRREVEKALKIGVDNFYYASSRRNRSASRYEHPDCSYIQVDIQYRLAKDSRTATYPDEDCVSKVSQPLLDLVSNKNRF
jgi:hypothetical protein